jgi:hypothetical protein
MLPVIDLLDQSLDKGVHAEHVQWGTFREARSVVTNITQAGVAGLGDSVGACKKNRMWMSSVATHQFWHSRFYHGVHKRVGEVRKPDKIITKITIDALHAVDKILEKVWKKAKTQAQEEMLLVDMLGTATSIQRLMKDGASDPHFKFVTIGGATRSQED